MRKAGWVAVLGLALAAGLAMPAGAQTAEEQAACRSDAVQYCRAHVGKQDEMKKCLAANKEKLSASCKKVVEARGG